MKELTAQDQCIALPGLSSSLPPRSFGSPLPFRFFQRMVAGGRVVENKSRAGAEEANSESGREGLITEVMVCPG